MQPAATKNIPIWSSCYATTQIQMASTCSCSVRHGGRRRRTASGISKSPKVSWVLTSATTSCSYTRYWGVTPYPDYGLGKGLSLKRFTSSPLFRDKAEQFYKKDAVAVIDAGEAALMRLYSGKEGDYLDGLRYAKFCDKVATNTAYPSSGFAPNLCSSEIPQYASTPAGTAVAGCLQYEGDRLGVDDKGREPRPCYDGPSSSTRRAAPCHQMQLHN